MRLVHQILELNRVCKNSVRYDANPDDPDAGVTAVYVSKKAFTSTDWPKEIILTVEDKDQ